LFQVKDRLPVQVYFHLGLQALDLVQFQALVQARVQARVQHHVNGLKLAMILMEKLRVIYQQLCLSLLMENG
jgi:hypothetical protein